MKVNGYDKIQPELSLEDEGQTEIDFTDPMPELTAKLKAISPKRETQTTTEEREWKRVEIQDANSDFLKICP